MARKKQKNKTNALTLALEISKRELLRLNELSLVNPLTLEQIKILESLTKVVISRSESLSKRVKSDLNKLQDVSDAELKEIIKESLK